MRIRKVLGIAGIVMLFAAACTDSNRPTPGPPTATNFPTQSPVRVELQQEYERLSATYKIMFDIWENLATGQTAQCGSYPDLPSPESISADEDSTYEALAEALYQAAVSLDHSLSLWKTECNTPRQFPPPDVIDEGRRATRAAGDTLQEANEILQGTP